MKTTILVAAMVLGAVGCGSEVDHPSTEPGATVTPAPTPTTQTARPQDEAIQNVKEIAAAAKAHFEKTGVLCLTALPVPAAVAAIAGTAYTPSTIDGDASGFATGDAETGWKCLGWKPSQTAIRYQPDYNMGNKYYLGSYDGGPNPGPNGFEAAAQGDINGDGTKYSLFTIAGTIDPDSGKLTLSELWSYNYAE